jgi:predicted RNA binding protein YcfA (HicA-like mRNA interferase family)
VAGRDPRDGSAIYSSCFSRSSSCFSTQRQKRKSSGSPRHDDQLRREIEHALGKFANGSYGKSELSGRPIGRWGAAKGRQVLAALLRIGWTMTEQEGSHRRLERDGREPYTFAFHDRQEIGQKSEQVPIAGVTYVP